MIKEFLMFRKIIITAAICWIALNAAFVCGQEITLEKSDFQAVVEKASAQRWKMSFRAVIINETYEDGNTAPVKVTKEVGEITASGDSRWIGESNGQKYEKLSIGGKSYRRTNNGIWEKKKSDRRTDIIAIGCSLSTISETYKLTPDSQINGKNVDFYEQTQRLGTKNCGKNKTGEQVITRRYWIAKDGLLLKQEFITEKIEERSLTKSAVTYDYDPSIKIVAPIK